MKYAKVKKVKKLAYGGYANPYGEEYTGKLKDTGSIVANAASVSDAGDISDGGGDSAMGAIGAMGPVGAVAGIAVQGFAQAQASKARREMMSQRWKAQKSQDAIALDNYPTKGEYVEYYANGGQLPTSPIKGKYATIGGKTKTIADGVEEVEGNTHEQKAIDNSYGVTLVNKQNGMPTANVEDEEVIVDGEYVFSDRLSPDGKSTFAKKMKSLAMKRNKVEEGLSEKQIDTKIRNGLERTLQGIDMKEKQLAEQQEMMKAMMPNANEPMLAYGGGIGDPTNPPAVKPKVAFNPSSEDFLPVRKIQKLTNPDGSNAYQYFYDKLPNEEGYSEDMNSHIYTNDEYINKTSKQHPEYSRETETYLKKTGNKVGRDIKPNYTLVQQPPKLANGGDIPNAIVGTFSGLGKRVLRGVGKGNLEEELDGEVGEAYKSSDVVEDSGVGEAYKSFVTPQDIAAREEGDDKSMFDYLAPTVMDNAMNLGLTIASPKLAKPIMKRARSLKTNINVNPQVGAVKNAVASSVDNIASNTSNSNVARANMVSARLRGSEQLGSIYANKENIETQLKNSDTMNKQAVDFGNVDTANNQNMLEFTRVNDIAGRLSANMADLSKNVGEAQTKKQLDTYYDEVMLLDLLDDKTGDKARVMKRNPYMNRSAMLRAALAAENKRLNR